MTFEKTFVKKLEIVQLGKKMFEKSNAQLVFRIKFESGFCPDMIGH